MSFFTKFIQPMCFHDNIVHDISIKDAANNDP